MPVLVKLWILGSAACVVAGWALSALHQLNGPGYFIFLALLGIAFAFWRRRNRPARTLSSEAGPRRLWRRKLWRRFRRPLPLLFAAAAALELLGGALYAPTNYDALNYRVPRLLHWWSQSGWHWIATPVQAMNRSGTNYEWLMMPIFLLTHSDRFFFLINLAAFLLLPGLLFTSLIAAGVAKRVAWTWMWLLPMAFCYVMQAGGIGNDLLAVTYVLAAIAYGLRAARHGSGEELRLAFLAAGLATGVKAANLPLLLPMACAAGPALRLLRFRPAFNAVTILVSLLISFLPTALLNQKFAGDWAGDPRNLEGMTIRNPLAGLFGNSLQLAGQTLLPPVFPFARPISTALWEWIPASCRAFLQHDFPKLDWPLGELPQEEGAGVGLGIALAAGSAAAFALFRRRKQRPTLWSSAARQGLLIGLAAWVALLAYMIRIGAPATGRLLAAYYPLLLLPVMLPGTQVTLVRRGWWKKVSLLAALAPLLALVLTPSRPLWPSVRFFEALQNRFPRSGQVARARNVYETYWHRNDVFAGLRQHLPPSAAVAGLIEDGGDLETSLWRPFGARRIVPLTQFNPFPHPNLEWVVVKNSLLGADPNAFAQWLKQSGAVLVAQESITEKVAVGPQTWSLVRFQAPPSPPAAISRDAR